MAKIIIVGGGVIGSMHAYLALKNGHQVIQCERDEIAQSASVRNFGLIWISGRESGEELKLALRAGELWKEVGNSVGTLGYRNNGSLTIATDEKVLEVVKSAAKMSDAAERGFEFLDREEVKKLEPSLAGNFLGALRCEKDSAVEPDLLLKNLREFLMKNGNYEWIPNFEVINLTSNENGNHVLNSNGKKLSGDFVVIATGAMHSGFIEEFLIREPIRKVRLQMAATTTQNFKLGHSIADGDSLRYYPAFKNLELGLLNPQSEVAAKFHMQLLLVQRLDGSLTIGDTHEYQEPFNHEIHEAPYEYLIGVIEKIFGLANLRISKRWEGIYSQSTSKDIYFRREVNNQVVIVTGGGGRGNTLAPAISEETFSKWKI